MGVKTWALLSVMNQPLGRAEYHSAIDAEAIGQTVGFEMLARLGEEVEVGQPLVRVFAQGAQVELVTEWLQEAITVHDEPPVHRPLIAERVS